MRWRRVRAEEQSRYKPKACKTSNAARLVAAAVIESAKGYLKAISGKVAVSAKETVKTLPEIGNDHNVSLIIARAGFDPCLPLAHLVGRSRISVSVSAPNLQTTEFVDQEEFGHA